MTRHDRDWDESDESRDSYDVGEFDDDNDDPIESDLDDSEPETVPCPGCGSAVSELSEKCPHCGDWIIPGGEPSPRKKWGLITWTIVAALILALSYLAIRG